MKNLVLIPLFLAIASVALDVQALPPPDIRVLIFEGRNASITGIDTPIQISFGIAPKSLERRSGPTIMISAGPRGLVFQGDPIGSEALLSNRTRRYEIEGKVLRGEIKVLWKGDSKLVVINNLSLEEYLVGLVGSEMYPGWPIEAYKAQAIAARTYALHHADAAGGATDRDYDVTATVLSQVYEGVNREADEAKKAVDATAGLVLMRDGAIFPAYYHSCCGGITEHAHNVWENGWGPPQIKDRFCERSPKRSWTASIPASEFMETLERNGIAIEGVKSISIRPEMDSPRVDQIIVEHDGGVEAIKATDLRSMFGFARIKSTWFDAKLTRGSVVFDGRGYGHGVGMCQWGAKGMADQRASYEQILKFYYADAQIRKAY